MKFRWLLLSLLALLTIACTTPTIVSNVTAFHEWPTGLRDKSYAFERSKEQDASLEYQSYENLVRAELARLGFTEAREAKTAALKASMSYSVTPRDIMVEEPVMLNSDPFWPRAPWRSFYGPFYGPYADPFWPGPPVVSRHTVRLFTRQFRFVLVQSASGKTVQEITVTGEDENPSLPATMPYMIRSAFMDFPGSSGVPRKIELKREKKAR